MAEEIAENLKRVREQVEEAAERAGSPGQVELIAVTKTVPLERIAEAYVAGQHAFGENRVQEGVDKAHTSHLAMPSACWHLIGHLQTNKVKPAVQAFSIVESVDSVRLASRLSRAAEEQRRVLPILLEVNVAGEGSKAGFAPDDLPATFPALQALPAIEIRGLMTVAPLAEAEDIRWVFRSLRGMRDRLQEQFNLPDLVDLSMGMSGDFEVAIEEGATMVRIGRAIFGERPPLPGTV